MARKSKTVVEETVVEETVVEETVVEETVVELSPEEVAIQAALDSDDPLTELNTLADSENCSEILNTIIGTYIALLNALGEDAPATQRALENVVTFKPAKLKTKRAKKVPKFNELKILRDSIKNDNLKEVTDQMLENDRVSDELKTEIITYNTLKDIGADEAVVVNAYNNLINFGKKRKTGGTTTRATFNIKAGDFIHGSLCGALEANRILKTNMAPSVEGKKDHSEQDAAWRTIRPKLLKGESTKYNGVEYSPTDEAVTYVKPVATKEATEEATEEA